MNNFTVIGNLTRDTETKTVNTKHGPETVTTINIACNGRDRTKPVYVRASAWGQVGKTIAKYAKAKSRMMLQGEATASAYLSRETGEVRATLELTVDKFEFLSSTAEAPQIVSEPAPAAVATAAWTDYDAQTEVDEYDSVEDEDLPF